jgi:hypothetical protein
MKALPFENDHSFLLDQFLSVLLVVFPFIPIAISVTTYRYLHLDYDITFRVQIYALAVFLALIVVGWIKGFPRWTYPYIVIIGTIFFALMVGGDRDMTFWENLWWKLMTLGPVVLLFTGFWLVLHKKHPLQRVVQNVRRDWTLFAFCIYNLLVIAIQGTFTDIRSVYGASFLYICTLLGMTGSALYILLSDKSSRLMALAVCFTLAWGVMTFATATFWDGRQEKWMETPADGLRLAAGYALAWVVMLALMFLPTMVGKLGRRTAKADG